MNYLSLALTGFLLLCAMAVPAADKTTVILGGSLVNLDGGPALENSAVVIRDGIIEAAGPANTVPMPDQARVIDASGTWLIPGLMNMHVHLGLVLPGKMAVELADESEAELALRMAAAARETLQAGVTTIRLPGEQRHGDLSLRKAIARGHVPGPRIYSAGEALRITGGHGSEPDVTYHDGPYELIKAARREISAGADWIKIMISGGIATDGGDIAQALMTPEEIRAVVDAAHRLGARVTAHSGSPAATVIAVDAGIDGIEHGYFLDRPTLRQMKKAGTWLVPTIVVSQPATADFYQRIGSPPWYLTRLQSVGKAHWRALELAIEEGVSIALGTDQLPAEPNDGTTATAREAQYYVEAGMSPTQALRAATIEPARMLGADDVLGSLTVGKHADLVALGADPIEDIKALRDIRLVIKGGAVYRNELEDTP
ncbi:MAG: amidohydrolase family protein [Xanthomonadales bacterium]|nr:amidohydrolase family protein [Xanthomonadales bacterium]